MREESNAAYINAQVACALMRMNGMIAENQYCVFCGETPKYLEKDFLKVIEEEGIYHNATVSMLRGE